MPKHLILPKSAFKDIRTLLRLDVEKLSVLRELFATPESISPTSPGFIQKVAERLHLDLSAAQAVVLVCQFLLTVVEEGHPPSEIVEDVREFLVQNAPAEEKDVIDSLDSKRKVLELLLTPTPERSRALKVRYLGEVHPTWDSFRTVCELRPVFDRKDDREEIVGYVPVVLLEAKQSDAEDEEERILFHLSPRALKALSEAIQRAEEKLAIIRRRFGGELLGEVTRE